MLSQHCHLELCSRCQLAGARILRLDRFICKLPESYWTRRFLTLPGAEAATAIAEAAQNPRRRRASYAVSPRESLPTKVLKTATTIAEVVQTRNGKQGTPSRLRRSVFAKAVHAQSGDCKCKDNHSAAKAERDKLKLSRLHGPYPRAMKKEEEKRKRREILLWEFGGAKRRHGPQQTNESTSLMAFPRIGG